MHGALPLASILRNTITQSPCGRTTPSTPKPCSKAAKTNAICPISGCLINLNVYADMSEALRDSELVLVVTPVVGLRSSVELLKQHGGGHLPILTACKGFELDTGLLTYQVVQEVLPENPRIGVLSGPSFAQELAQQLPCAVCLASENEAWLHGLVQALNTNVMRLYANSDVIGVSVGGAVKNIMAIATGLSDG